MVIVQKSVNENHKEVHHNVHHCPQFEGRDLFRKPLVEGKTHETKSCVKSLEKEKNKSKGKEETVFRRKPSK